MRGTKKPVLGDKIIWLGKESWKIKRHSKDRTVNNKGKELLSLCSMFNFKILKGCSEKGKTGEFTCLNSRGASVVDYCITSEELRHRILEFKVEERTEADHMPLVVYIQVKKPYNYELENTKDPEYKMKKFSWRKEKSPNLIRNWESPELVKSRENAEALLAAFFAER